MVDVGALENKGKMQGKLKTLIYRLTWSLLLTATASSLAMAATKPAHPATTAAKSKAAAVSKSTDSETAADPKDPKALKKGAKKAGKEAGKAEDASTAAADKELDELLGGGAAAKPKNPCCIPDPCPPPGVSAPNFWLGAAAGYLRNDRDRGGAGYGEVGFAANMVRGFAAQFHGYLGGVRGEHNHGANIESADAYFFWRHFCKGLIGPHLTYTHSGRFFHKLIGLHGEGYIRNITLVAEAGSATRSNRSMNGAYGELIVNYYPLPDWQVSVGAIDINGNVTGQIGTEYQFGGSGLALFLYGGAGAHQLRYGFLGLRYYFGNPCEPCKSLFNRHREDMIPATIDPIDSRSNRHIRGAHRF